MRRYRQSNSSSQSVVFHAHEKWAHLIIAMLEAPTDLRTTTEWARQCGRSLASLELLCHTIGIAPKQSLTLARLMRATHMAHVLQCRPMFLLDADPRTVKRLFGIAGFAEPLATGMPARDFLKSQRLVRDTRAAEALERTIRSSELGRGASLPQQD